MKATTHAPRRAFAVAFLETHPSALESLRVLMNHSRVDKTQVTRRTLAARVTRMTRGTMRFSRSHAV